MSEPLQEVAAAIKIAYDADAALVAATPGGIHLSEAVFEASDVTGYIVVDISTVPFYTFRNDFERLVIVFTAFTATRTAVAHLNLIKELRRVFDDVKIAVDHYHTIYLLPQDSGVERLDDRWSAYVEYECALEYSSSSSASSSSVSSSSVSSSSVSSSSMSSSFSSSASSSSSGC